MIIKVTAEITDSNGDLQRPKNRRARGHGPDRRRAVGRRLLFRRRPRARSATKELQKAIDKPQYNQSAGDPPSTIIKAKPESPFSIEILVTSKDQAPKDAKGWAEVARSAPRNDGGEPFVDIKRDEVYAIRVHNKFEFAGDKVRGGRRRFGRRHRRLTFSEIRDPKTKDPNTRTTSCRSGKARFPAGTRPMSTPTRFWSPSTARAPLPGNPIGAAGRWASSPSASPWPGPASVPEAEKGSRDASNETGFGPPTQTELKEVARQVGTVRDVISVRYTR